MTQGSNSHLTSNPDDVVVNINGLEKEIIAEFMLYLTTWTYRVR